MEAEETIVFGVCFHPHIEESDQFFVHDLLLLVREMCEFRVRTVQLLLCQRVSQFGIALFQRVPAGMFPENQRAMFDPHRLRRHDFVGDGALQDAVLVNSRLMGKRVGAHDSLVALDGHSRQR